MGANLKRQKGIQISGDGKTGAGRVEEAEEDANRFESFLEIRANAAVDGLSTKTRWNLYLMSCRRCILHVCNAKTG